MFFGLTVLPSTHSCLGKHAGSVQRGAKAFDTLAIIALLVVGILGLKRIIPLSPAAAYACIGGSVLLAVIVPCVAWYVVLRGVQESSRSISTSLTNIQLNFK